MKKNKKSDESKKIRKQRTKRRKQARINNPKTKYWVLEAGPARWKHKGLRAFKDKDGVLAELRNNLRPEYTIRHGYEIINETDSLIRFLEYCDDDELSYEVAQAVPIQVEGNLDKIWILTLPDKPRNRFHIYTTKEDARQAFLRIYEDAGRPLFSYYEDEQYILEHDPDHTLEPEEANELVTATCCNIEDTPQKLHYICPKCHCAGLLYIKGDSQYVVDLRYASQIVHDYPSIVAPASFREESPFYMCAHCYQMVIFEGKVIRDKESLADFIINEREKEIIWLEISHSHEGDGWASVNDDSSFVADDAYEI